MAQHKRLLRRFIRRAQDDIRDERDEAHIAALMNSILAQGFQGSLTVFEVSTDCWEVVDGTTTLIALERLGIEEVDVNILPERPDAKTLRMMRLRRNLIQADMKSLEEARNYREAMFENGWSQKELARELGGKQFEPRISKAIRVYENLIDPLKEVLRRGEMKDKVAWAIARLPAEMQLPFWNEHNAKKAEAIVDLVASLLDKEGSGTPKETRLSGSTPGGIRFTLPTKDPKATLAELKRLVAGWEWIISKKLPPKDLEFFFRTNPT